MVHRNWTLVTSTCSKWQTQKEGEMLDAVHANPLSSNRRVAYETRCPQSTVWCTHAHEQLYSFHAQLVQELQPGNNNLSLHFSQWCVYRTVCRRTPLLACRELWTDEATFKRSGATNLHDLLEQELENCHATRRFSFQHRFNVKVWVGIVDNCLSRISLNEHFYIY